MPFQANSSSLQAGSGSLPIEPGFNERCMAKADIVVETILQRSALRSGDRIVGDPQFQTDGFIVLAVDGLTTGDRRDPGAVLYTGAVLA
jgi:hypothetical protein